MLWSSDTPFSYASIPPASSDVVTDQDFQAHRIRLLRFTSLPLISKVPKCKLRTVGLVPGDQTAAQCRALSYVHGSDDHDKEIQVNGKRCRVSGNLYDCLEVMSKDGKGKRWGDLWIDQICIDNSNTAERSRQVKRMSDIYTQAKEVLVWLGKGLHSDFAAVDLILRSYECEQPGAEKENLTSDEKDLLESFIKNPYFTRLWAVQELVLANKITILIGDRELSWDTMISVYRKHIFNPHAASLRDMSVECSSLQRISIARTQRSVLDIFDVINGFCKYDCTDPRDHLFGLLGLLNIHEPDKRKVESKLSLTVDYSMSLEAVYLNFCFEMLESIPETNQLYDILVLLAHAMGFEGVFYGGVSEDEVLEFFRGAGSRSGTDVKGQVRNKLQSKTTRFQDAADYLAQGIPAEYDMLSGDRMY